MVLRTDKDTRAHVKRSFFGALWHGAFLALGTALTQPSTVINAFIADLTGSTSWVGGLSTVLSIASTIPQLFVARWIEPRPRKKPLLLVAIYLRTLSWGTLAWLIFFIGAAHPMLLAWTLVGLLAIFSIGGGLGGVPYTHIIGRVIPPDKRGAFFGGRQALSGPLAIGAALLAQRVLTDLPYPNNYALLFGLAALSLFIASVGFWIIPEEPEKHAKKQVSPWTEYLQQLRTTTRQMKGLIAVQVLTGFSLMALPFYIVYARQELGAPASAIGWFTLVQVVGGTLANLLWARLVDRFSSWHMVTTCAIISALTPLLAIALSPLGWKGMLPILFLTGATANGRTVGFPSALLEIAPPAELPTYTAVNTILALPIGFLPMGAGIFLHYLSYPALFALASLGTGIGAWLSSRYAIRSTAKIELET
ncbi:MAG: MFS transporter [Anaerolineae bacterium]|nr:MFS transporter [Anaerolineae bacterium]